MDPIIWPILLMLAAIALIVLELFIPSAGMLSVLAILAAVAGVVMAYYNHGPMVGTIFFGVAVVGAPLLIASSLRWWPHTPFGRLILNNPPQGDDEVLPDTKETRFFRGLDGRRGIAKSPLLPAGVVTISGHTIDAVSRGEAIDAGEPIEVVHVEGNHVIVRAITNGLREDDAEEEEADLLSRPIESLGLDTLEDPLA